MSTDMTRLGSTPGPQQRRSTWVQTERAAHQAWAKLVRSNARAATLLHVLVAHMDHQSAIVASRATLGRLAGYSEATVKRAIADLRADCWIDVVQLGGKGGVNAYVVNSRVAWADSRERLGTAVFTARVIASQDEQEIAAIETPLRRIPTLYPGERQLPTGPGEPPPSQPSLPELEPDLPGIRKSEPTITHEELEKRGQLRLSIDPETGEIL